VRNLQEVPEFAAGHQQQLAADVRQPYLLRHGLLVELPIMSDGPVVITGRRAAWSSLTGIAQIIDCPPPGFRSL
jgi:hypothetical protein